MCIALETMYVVDVDSADVIAKGGDDREDGDSGNPLSKGEKEDAMVVGGGGAGTGEGIGAGVRVGGNGGMDDLTVVLGTALRWMSYIAIHLRRVLYQLTCMRRSGGRVWATVSSDEEY
jgi:hypothetical protein